MADLRLWNREMINDLIEKYKSLPCLWKVKSEGYSNKHMKSAAYRELVKFCRKRGFPDATRDFVVKKLQSLRGSFRKELRKTRQLQRQGKKYQSNLWYYNNLMFTKESDDDAQSDDEACQSAGDGYEEAEVKFVIEEEPASAVVDRPSYSQVDPPDSPPQTKERKSSSEDFPQTEFFDVAQEEPSKFKDLSEFELIGLTIAKKLARMDSIQAIYAESIINSVIRKGLLKKLKEETDLCDGLCGKRAARDYYPS